MKNVRGVILSEDEVVIREYEASYISNPKSEGYVIATNRRLIFTGSTKSVTGSGVIVRDTKIDNISGINAGLSHQRSFTTLIIGAIIALLGLMYLFNDFGIIPLAVLAIGAFLVYRGLKSAGTMMHISILGGQSSAAISVAVEASTGIFSRVRGNQAIMTVAASGPGKHTEQLIREIGALIQDIQIMGDLAIEKWRDIPVEANAVSAPTSVLSREQLDSTINIVKNTASKVKDSAINASNNVQETVNQVKESKENNLQSNTTEVVTDGTKCKCGAIVAAGDTFCSECGIKQEVNIFG